MSEPDEVTTLRQPSASDLTSRPFPRKRMVMTIAMGVALVIGLFSFDRELLFTPFPILIVLAMAVAGLLNSAVVFRSWERIQRAASRGACLALTGLVTGAVAGACLGACLTLITFTGFPIAVPMVVLAIYVGLINAMVLSVGGAADSRARPPQKAAMQPTGDRPPSGTSRVLLEYWPGSPSSPWSASSMSSTWPHP